MTFLSSINIDFFKYKVYAVSCSGILIVLSVLLILFKGICFGTDFAGGIVIELRVDQVNVKDINLKLQESGFVGFSVQSFNNNNKELMICFKNEKTWSKLIALKRAKTD